MSSITFNVSYNTVTKKVTVPRASTISQVSDACLLKFGVANPDVVGQLSTPNGKVLDGSLPIRLTALTNNSKLKLDLLANAAKELNVKFTVNFEDGESKTLISKVPSDQTLSQLIAHLEEKNSIKLVSETKDSQLVVMNSIYASQKYHSTKLSALVGGGSSLLVRMSYLLSEEENAKRIDEQQSIVKLQLKRQKERNEQLREERERIEELRVQNDRNDVLKREREELEKQQKEDEDLKEQHKSGQTLSEHTKEDQLEHKTKPKAVAAKEVAQDIEMLEFTEELSESPSLYIPSASSISTGYENPDEDYNMTASQVQIYRNIIKASGEDKTAKVEPPILPQKYLIRVKFPDRSILQVNFINDASQTKLGQLIRKIDELIFDRFVGKYNLKLSYPPFKQIEMSFSENNSFLHSLADFQNERITLIWELKGGVAVEQGPYIKTDSIEVKLSTELPEVVLESHRSELPEGERAANVEPELPVARPTPNNETPRQSNGKPVPKWFKLN